MKIRLLKRWKFWPIGQKMEVYDTKAKQLIQSGIAEKFDGDMKVVEKMKTDLFKPKNIKRNVKG